MRQRIISALVGLVILAVVLALLDTLFFNLVMAVLGIMAVMELLNATKCSRFKSITALSVLMAVVIPFVQEERFRILLPPAFFVLLLLFFCTLLRHNDQMRVEQVAMAFLFSLFVPVFFSSAVFIRNDFGVISGGFYLIWALGSAWLCDTGAYFTGIRFGKHKLAPRVSPKKTVEGAVGGIITATVCMALLALLYQWILGRWFDTQFQVSYPLLICLTPVFAVIGMLGDLSASVIKRQFQVKDYGSIMPGHGGILDRFDSALFTLPAVYIAMRFYL